uniref:ATP synthase F0 subunit 8 n=1 Tax=Vaceletia sp. GW948 TaxID=479641 RepID=I6LIS9_9METZ|nr:ATP synthase F0 subunit 8 [Vaceletia sp. GW948]ABW83975.1 ATP synthase F0 subunit 8 [Vaceletia sp. GW948]
MPQLDSFYYFEEYLVGGGVVLVMYYLFRHYIIPWEICRSKIVSGLELDTSKSGVDYKIIGVKLNRNNKHCSDLGLKNKDLAFVFQKVFDE